MVKKLPRGQETQETRIWSLGVEGPLEEGMATHSSILTGKIPWTEEPGRLQSTGSQRVRHHWVKKQKQFSLWLFLPSITSHHQQHSPPIEYSKKTVERPLFSAPKGFCASSKISLIFIWIWPVCISSSTEYKPLKTKNYCFWISASPETAQNLLPRRYSTVFRKQNWTIKSIWWRGFDRAAFDKHQSGQNVQDGLEVVY